MILAIRSTKRTRVPELFGYMKTYLTDAYIFRVRIETLKALGISEVDAIKVMTDLRDSFDKSKIVFLDIIEKLLPNRHKDNALARLVTYRNKLGAHQQRLDEALKQELAFLPSLDDMERLNNWAANFCLLCIQLLTPNVTFLRNTRSSRMAALNVALKLPAKNFDNADDEEQFFSRI
jgi:hypothetical protein